MSSSLFSSKKVKRKPRIEIIPMVDVMFLLLVFYILSTIALTTERGIPVSLPQAGSSESTTVDETTITINDKREIFLNRQQVTLEALGSALEALALSSPGGMAHMQESYVVLNVDMEAPHRMVVGVMDELRALGITNFSISTDEGGA